MGEERGKEGRWGENEGRETDLEGDMQRFYSRCRMWVLFCLGRYSGNCQCQ